jgi:histone-arginine methyltransferase CARM1
MTYDMNIPGLRREALTEYLRQPVVDTFDPRICLAHPQAHRIDFSVADETDLHTINIQLSFTLQSTGYIHGLAFWFDVAFIGSE